MNADTLGQEMPEWERAARLAFRSGAGKQLMDAVLQKIITEDPAHYQMLENGNMLYRMHGVVK